MPLRPEPLRPFPLGHPEGFVTPEERAAKGENPPVDEKRAMRAAMADAQLHYDITAYAISVTPWGPDWRVDFTPRDREVNGGGPIYVVSSETGAILHKVYNQ
jgi:hypothetical protein